MARALIILTGFIFIVLGFATDGIAVDANAKDLKNVEHTLQNVSVGPEGSSGSELAYLDNAIDKTIQIDSVSRIEFLHPGNPVKKYDNWYIAAKIFRTGSKNASEYFIKTATKSNKKIYLFGDNNNRLLIENCISINFNINEQTKALPGGQPSKGFVHTKPSPEKSTRTQDLQKGFPLKLGDIESIKPN